MDNNFKKALDFTIRWEGFISNDPQDAGGMTIWGISYRSHPKAVLEMERLINEQKKDEAFDIAEHIYWNDYWLKGECDKKIFPANILVFDTAVNLGLSRAKEFYDASTDWQDYLFKRIAFYTKCKNANIYLKGWVNRVIALYHFVKERRIGENA